MIIKKIYVNTWYMAIVSGLTLTWIITLFLLNVWYNREAVRVANTDYVREVTKWPGHTHVSNYPVEYELYKYGIQLIKQSMNEELLNYAGCDGWAAMLRHEWQIPQFPFIRQDKLNKCIEKVPWTSWDNVFARLQKAIR